MIPAERRMFIVGKVAEKGVASIAALSEELGVSQMTVRRDIEELKRDGKVISVTGGVQLAARDATIEATPSGRQRELAAIARFALSIVKADDVIFLDTGAVSQEIARRLRDFPNLTVVTSDIQVSAILAAESTCQLWQVGGRVDRANKSCVGESAANMIRRFSFDLAFISPSSWSEQGISTPAEDSIAVQSAAVECSVRSVLVADSARYRKLVSYNSLSLRSFTTIITDGSLPPPARAAVEAVGVGVVLAS